MTQEDDLIGLTKRIKINDSRRKGRIDDKVGDIPRQAIYDCGFK
nr:hypothetical protein [uncultured Desulfobacter sp.]